MSRRRPHRRLEVLGEGLFLAAMVDMMVNLLIFLLHLYGNDPSAGAADGIEHATTTAAEPVIGGVTLVVRTDAIVVNGERVADLGAADRDERLFEALRRENGEAREKAATAGEEYAGEIVLEVDKRIPWPDVRSVLKTAGKAGFWDLKFVVSASSDLQPDGSG